MCVCVCVCVCARARARVRVCFFFVSYFLGEERAFWPAEERIPLIVDGGCPDDRLEDQMLLLSWVECGLERGVPSPEDHS